MELKRGNLFEVSLQFQCIRNVPERLNNANQSNLISCQILPCYGAHMKCFYFKRVGSFFKGIEEGVNYIYHFDKIILTLYFEVLKLKGTMNEWCLWLPTVGKDSLKRLRTRGEWINEWCWWLKPNYSILGLQNRGSGLSTLKSQHHLGLGLQNLRVWF